MPARNAAPFDLESLKAALPKIFDQVQNTSANHQKNYVALYKLHREAEQIKASVQNDRSSKLVGEKAFWDVFDDMMLRVLPIKKGVGQADRTVKFMGGYTKFAMEKSKSRFLLDGAPVALGELRVEGTYPLGRRRVEAAIESLPLCHSAPTRLPFIAFYSPNST